MVATILIPKQADQDARRLVPVAGRSGIAQLLDAPISCKTIRVAGSRVYASGVFNLAELMPVGSSKKHLLRPLPRYAPTTAHALPKADKSAPQVADPKSLQNKSTFRPPIYDRPFGSLPAS